MGLFATARLYHSENNSVIFKFDPASSFQSSRGCKASPFVALTAARRDTLLRNYFPQLSRPEVPTGSLKLHCISISLILMRLNPKIAVCIELSAPGTELASPLDA